MLNTKTIHIDIDYGGDCYGIDTFPNEYRSLMALIFDRIGPEDFGECLGMGKCATCAIELIDNSIKLTDFDRNEDNALKKHGLLKNGVRLSCQLQIDENLNNVKVKIIGL